MTHGLMALELTYAPAPADGGRDAPELVARLREGSATALGVAYDLHHAPVRAFARRLVGDDASAEDVVQETFVALPRAIRGYRGDCSLRAFLLGIAVNHARHHVRAAARRRAAMDRLAKEEPRRSPPPPPDAGVENGELAQILARALDRLSIEHRATFVLCEVEERSSVEAAAILGVPEGTVRTRLLHAKRKLRAWFEREGIR
jgi:RNA polymerase sigma-70 factor (ECF subfamily)